MFLTKDRTLHVAPASPEGWKERARHGAVLGHRLDAAQRGSRRGVRPQPRRADPRGVDFGRRELGIGRDLAGAARLGNLRPLPRPRSRARRTSRPWWTGCWPAHPMVPWWNPDRVVFLYRGDASDVGIITDLIGLAARIPCAASPARISSFTRRGSSPAPASPTVRRNFDAPMPDPRNPRRVPAVTGSSEASSLAMPGWREPDHLAEGRRPKGRLEPLELSSTMRGGARADAARVSAGWLRQATAAIQPPTSSMATRPAWPGWYRAASTV